MPEGDTIHRTAARLRPALVGQTVASFRAARLVSPGPAPGTAIDAVEANGKYLLIRFGDGTVLETHMKMTGSWHLYRVGERWRRSEGAARAVIETEHGWIAVCFSAPHVKLIEVSAGARRTGATDHLGPDLCLPDPDLDEVMRRFSIRGEDAPLVDVLLDQRVCSGVGNVYKSEVLFACRLHPLTPVGDVSEAARRHLVTTANVMLRENLGPGARSTVVVDGRRGLAVYGRSGQPCVACGTAISRGRLGRHHRSSYWCEVCQEFPGPAEPQNP